MGTVLDDSEFKSIIDHFSSLAVDTPIFSKLLDFSIESPDFEHARLRFPMRDIFIGNIVYRSLHGAVTCAMLDNVGAHAVFLKLFQKLKDEPRDKLVMRISRIGAVNLRIDYLLPGIGDEFIATSYILRMGNKVAVTRMELRNEDDKLIAVGTGTYTVG